MSIIRQVAQLGHPVLREAATEVPTPLPDAARRLSDDMVATMLDANGVGIAAPQVYESLAIFVVASRPNPRYPSAPWMEPQVVINPRIVERSDEIVKDWEGCLSIPGLRGLVPRHQRIRVCYRTLDGEMVDREYSDFIARIFQHEDDHLHGLVFLDRLESPRDVMTEKEFQRQLARLAARPADPARA